VRVSKFMIGLGERMKGYEGVPDILLTRRLPILLRVDGRAFHTYTKAFDKPFDPRIHEAMEKATADLLHEISGAVFGYFQSDEISVLIRTDMTLETEPWFGGRVQKIVSVAAAIASVSFSLTMLQRFQVDRPAHFDARVFVLPPEEVNNYFLWRERDAIRNSILSLGQAHFPHKMLMGKSTEDVCKMLTSKGIEWGNLPIPQQRGQGMLRSGPFPHPSFSVDPGFIQSLLAAQLD